MFINVLGSLCVVNGGVLGIINVEKYWYICWISYGVFKIFDKDGKENIYKYVYII